MLSKAAVLAQLSDVPKFKIGAILVHKKTILSQGFNKRKTHPLQYQYNQLRESNKRNRSFIHAEMDCLIGMNRFREIPKNSILFIGRTNTLGDSLMCRPCEGCMQYIIDLGISEIVYNTPNGYAVEKINTRHI